MSLMGEHGYHLPFAWFIFSIMREVLKKVEALLSPYRIIYAHDRPESTHFAISLSI